MARFDLPLRDRSHRWKVLAGRGPLRDAQVWKIVFAIAILCVPQFAVLTFATVFLHDARHLGVAGITATLFTVQIGAMAARVWSGHWTDRKGNRREYLQTCCMLSVGAFAALALLSRSPRKPGPR